MIQAVVVLVVRRVTPGAVREVRVHCQVGHVQPGRVKRPSILAPAENRASHPGSSCGKGKVTRQQPFSVPRCFRSKAFDIFRDFICCPPLITTTFRTDLDRAITQSREVPLARLQIRLNESKMTGCTLINDEN